MQTQNPLWKAFQKTNVGNLVAKSSVAAVFGLFSIGAVLGMSGEGTVAHPVRAKESTQSSAPTLPPAGERRNREIQTAQVASSSPIKKLVAHHIKRRALRKPDQNVQPRAEVVPMQNVPLNRPLLVQPTVMYSETAPVGETVASRVGTHNTFQYPYCTWWADERYHQLHGVYVPWTHNADAWEWVARARQFGWHISSRPIVGAILVLQRGIQGAGTVGHVAVVEQILPNGRVLASSSNWGRNPRTITRWQFSVGAGVAFVTS